MVPKGWELRELKELTTIYDGTHATPKYVESGVPFYSVEHLTKGDFSKTKFITEEVFDKENKRVKLERHDILMTRIGDIGTAVHLDWDVRASFYVSLALLKATSNFDSSFMTQYINSSEFHRELWKRIIHVAFPKKINLGEIGKCHVCLPPLPEQRKIAAILGTWDKAISTTERLIDNSKQQKKALMQQLLTGKKRLLDDSGRPFEGEWERKSFKEVLRLDRGSSPRPIVNFVTEDSDGVNWIKIGDTKNATSYITSTKERISLEGAKKSRKVSAGEIIVSNSMSYGKPYILKIDGYIHDGWFVLRDYQKHMDTTFLIQLLSSEFVQAQYKRLAAGGVVTNISSELVYAVKVNLPEINEQTKIAAVLSNADKEVVLFEKQLAALKQEKKALMQQLLTGKRRVKVNDKEVA